MLSAEDEAVVASAIASVPSLCQLGRAKLQVSRLGGLTNLVYSVVPPSGTPLCLRVPGKGTEAYIDRKAEHSSVAAAARAGVGPDVIHFGGDGVMLMPLVPGATMSPHRFATTAGAAARAGAALKRLHTSAEAFASRFELFEQIDKYLKELGDGATLPEGYHEALATAQGVRAALAARPLPSAPCHCDPLCENFIDDEGAGRMWIVDFEYGGMNDPLWDLGGCVPSFSLRFA